MPPFEVILPQQISQIPLVFSMNLLAWVRKTIREIVRTVQETHFVLVGVEWFVRFRGSPLLQQACRTTAA